MRRRVSVRLLSLFLAVLMVFGCGVSNALAAGAFGSDQVEESGKTPIISFSMDELTEGKEITNSADDQSYLVEGENPTLVDGMEGHGKALQLDGKTNYVNLGTKYQITTGQATVAAWVKVDENPNGLSRIVCRSRTAVSGENDLALHVRSNGKLEAELPRAAASGENAVQLGTWQHVAAVNDGNLVTLYVNGEVVTTASAEEFDPAWEQGLLIGAGWDNAGTSTFPDHMFKGLLDDLLIYDTALTSDEICALAGVEPDPDPGDVELPDAIYEFTMNEVGDGTGELEGQKVIYDTDRNEYPIYGNYRVDDFGIYDQSIEFDGSSTYVDIGRPDIAETYTLEAWTNIDAATQSDSRLNKIFGRDKTTVAADALYLCVRGNGNIEFQLTPNKGSTGGGWLESGEGTYSFNSWNHIAVTYDGETYKLYYNGELINTSKGDPVDQQTNPMNMLIGAGYNAEGTGIFTGHAFKGRLDDVRIYNVALTDAQIKKSTEGIKENLPPEVTAVSPASSMIDVTGVVSLTYSDTVELGEAVPTIAKKDGTLVDCTFELADQNEKIEGMDTLVITPDTELIPGDTYTYTLPAGVVQSTVGTESLAGSYTFTVKQKLEGNAAQSGMEYWVNDFYQDTTPNKSYINETEDTVVIGNGLVERTFDLNQNFLTVDYTNLYTGIQALDKNNLQADIRMALCDDFYDEDDSHDVLFDVGGTNDEVPTFQFVDYTIENSTEEIFHWEWQEDISPDFMKDANWPATGKALVVNYKAPADAGIYAGVTVQVRYEIYDGIPVICKRVTVENTGEADVVVHHLTSEVLPIPTSLEDAIYMEGSMNTSVDGGWSHDRNNGRLQFTKWLADGDTGLLMSRYTQSLAADAPEYGPAYRIKQGEKFEAYRVYELFQSSSYFEWQMMEVRAMYQVLFPQTLDAPLIYHIISSDPTTVKKGIDEAVNAGFNMVLLSFGSGVNCEDISDANIAKYKDICDYAHERGILVGSYIMQVARSDGNPSDIYHGCWNGMRCMNTVTAQTTQENNLKFIEATGMDCMEIDGIYPGTVCTAADCSGHGHEGREDSAVKQWEYGVRDYLKELRGMNVYINAPDWSYMAGANMAVMGYVEAGFNVSRQRQLIYGREMAYYGTFEKMPAMGWTLVPLSPYQGGDESSFWPYNERIQEYDYLIGVNMMYGVVGSYRGGNGLYQEGPAQNVMETWGEFYNKYRDILGEDVVHIAPPLAVSDTSLTTKAIDGIVHVSTVTEQRALAAFFNQTEETVTQKVKIPIYYTGLTDCDAAPAPVEGSHYRTSYVVADLVDMPEVPDIPEVDAVPTEKQVYVCIGDMNGQYCTVDSNGNIEVELTMEPNTYTWLTVYDPENIPEDVQQPVTIPAPVNVNVGEQTSNSIGLTWDAVQMDGRDVKEYHIYRNGEYIGKTFTNSYTDNTVETEQDYVYEVAAVHNTVVGEKAQLDVSTRPDTEGPEAVSAKAISATEITVTFSERLDQESAENVANYTVAGAAVTAAKLTNKTVTLTLDKALPAYETVEIIVRDVKDAAGNAMAAEAKLEAVFGYLRKFSFEEAEGNVAVDSIEGQNGSIGGVTIERSDDGISGKALVFSGKDNYVDIGHVVETLNTYSITGWFKPDTVDGTQVLVGQQRDTYDGWRYNLALTDGVLTFTVNNGKGAYPGHEADGEVVIQLSSGEQKVNAGEWNQFGIVRDGDTFRLYLNGAEVASDTKAGIDQSGTLYTMWLGGYRNNAGGEPTACFDGMMDEVQIYSAVRTESQIKDEYDNMQDDGGSTGGGSSSSSSYTITVTQSEGGKISPSTTSVRKGSDKTFTITANEGYKIADVLVDGKSVGAVSTYTFKNVTARHTITAKFEKNGETGNVGGFIDVKSDDWFADAVEYVVDNGLMNGTSSNTFTPNGATTRGMIVTILYRQAGSPKVESDKATWWSDARVWAMENGVSDGTNMDKEITREQLATMLYRYADLMGENVSKTTSLDSFKDGNKVSAYAVDALKWAAAEGIVTGKTGGIIDPQAGATRAETATMFMRFCEAYA